MIRRNKPSQPTGGAGYGAAPGAADSYGSGAGGGYGSQPVYGSQPTQSSSSYGGAGYGGAGGGGDSSSGGYSSGNSNGGSGGYSGYGGNTGGGGFGVGSGAAAYSDSPYGSTNRSSMTKGKKNKKSGAAFSPLAMLLDKFVLALLLAIVFMATTLYYRSRHQVVLEKFHVTSIMDAVQSYERLEKDKKRFQKEAGSNTDQQRNFKNTIRDLEKQNRELRKASEDVKMKYEASGGLGVEESEKLKAREQAWKKQVQLLQNATSRESKRAVTER